MLSQLRVAKEDRRCLSPDVQHTNGHNTQHNGSYKWNTQSPTKMRPSKSIIYQKSALSYTTILSLFLHSSLYVKLLGVQETNAYLRHGTRRCRRISPRVVWPTSTDLRSLLHEADHPKSVHGDTTIRPRNGSHVSQHTKSQGPRTSG